MVSDYKITMEQAEYEMVCYRRVFNFVRLLDQEKLEKLNAEGLLAAEGGQTKKADLCIGHFCQGCVAMEAFLRKAELCKLEFIGDDIYQIMAKYLEIDGNPYVMELLKKMDKSSLIDRKDHERLIRSLTGYNERLYQDVLTKAYNRRYYEEELKSKMGPAGIRRRRCSRRGRPCPPADSRRICRTGPPAASGGRPASPQRTPS